MQSSTDRTHRGNAISCQLSRKHHRGTFPERISQEAIVMPAGATASTCAPRIITIELA
jgi:hypothetical protein